MSDNTKIQWTEATWNPVRATYSTTDGVGQVLKRGWHCERVSPGCQHCYAERLNEKRFGTGLPYNRKSRDLVDIYLDEKALTQPLHWRRPRKVFVCSMTDLFGEWVPDETIDRVFAVMALSKSHAFQVLTKRPERMREYVSAARERIAAVIRDGKMTTNQLYAFDMAGSVEGLPGTVHGLWWPLPNVWLGTSVEDQERADQRIPYLLATPAAVRFVSAEPLLGPVEFDPYLNDLSDECRFAPHGLNWVIVGGESGPGARPCDLDWIRDIVRQCQAAGVAVFVKQLGARPCVGSVETAAGSNVFVPDLVRLRDRKGGDMSEWPEDLRVREFPGGLS